MADVGGVAGAQLRSLIERIERQVNKANNGEHDSGVVKAIDVISGLQESWRSYNKMEALWVSVQGLKTSMISSGGSILENFTSWQDGQAWGKAHWPGTSSAA